MPYLMSSHPGCTLEDAVELAEFLNKTGRQPEQVQDFYPTPGTLSTCMWYTGIDPRTMEEVYVARDPHEKALQRALLQWKRPEMRRLVTEALHRAGRTDLIGYGKDCLIRPLHSGRGEANGERSGEKSGKTAPVRRRDGSQGPVSRQSTARGKSQTAPTREKRGDKTQRPGKAQSGRPQRAQATGRGAGERGARPGKGRKR